VLSPLQPEASSSQAYQIPSNTLVFSVEALSYAVFALTLAVYVLTAWVIVKRSPPLMDSYRWYLLLNVSSTMAMVLAYVLILPIPLLGPYPIVIYDGWPLCAFAPVDPVILYATQSLWYIILALMGSPTITLFVYRYCQLRGNWFYTRVLQSVPLTVGVNLLLSVVASLVFIPHPAGVKQPSQPTSVRCSTR
jgi:hypothetical protein